jgi:hypothetical protein
MRLNVLPAIVGPKFARPYRFESAQQRKAQGARQHRKEAVHRLEVITKRKEPGGNVSPGSKSYRSKEVKG